MLVYSKDNCYIGQNEMQLLAHYFQVYYSLTQSPTQKIATRQFIEIPKAGHALMDDNPLEFLKYFE